MKSLDSLTGLMLAALTVAGCHTTYVLGRNDVPDAGASGGRGSDASVGTGTGGGLGGNLVVPGSGGVSGVAGAATGGGAPVGLGGATGAAGNALSALPPAPNAPATPQSAGTLALQHLTLEELENTIADLLGISPTIVAAAAENAGLSPLGDYGPQASTGYLAPGEFQPAQTQGILSLAEQVSTVPPTSLTASCTAPAAGTAATACATTFISTFGRRAFRRPVTATEATALLDLFNTAVGLGFDFQGALTQVVRGMLQSPNFLYHWEVGDTAPVRAGGLITLTSYQIASRLSYLLWQTMPDDTLLAAADNDQLSTPDKILLQANRMLADPRSKVGLGNFHRQWLLQLNGRDSLHQDLTLFPTFTPLVQSFVRAETDAFVSSIVSTMMPSTGDGTLKTLLTASYSFPSESTVAGLYGTALSVPGERLELNPAQRAGILTQIAFLATDFTETETNPIGRGFVVWQKLLCGTSNLHPSGLLPPPNIQFGPTATLREVVTQTDSQTPCADCHAPFDSLGFAFGNYDAIGGYQTMDKGHPIDASGSVVTPGGTKISFQNAIDLVNALAASDEVKWCATRQWFRFVLGRMESPSDEGSMELAYRAGAAVPGFSIRQMLTSLVQSQTFRYRAPSPGEL